MPSFRYQYGDRPLEGFTIQHGVGRGGFGEVYFAISDTGREVALKSVQQYEDIELRGIGHCMNLKSPHLVSIFDIRHSNNREPFVVMEYVNGPSLRDVMDEAPHGLGTVKAVYLLREIAKGLSFLHQNGVVHRDLKPHNVFIEQGLVKIGDYSLSKIMTASHRSGHTVTVGTVHYMAPEIGLGRYDHTVDIYALGVMFYELLTGVPPFRGDSVGEVLMKHIAGDPELSHIAAPLADVIRKAMCKDPRQRYQSVDQMVEEVLNCAGVVVGLDKVSPDDLSMIAKREIQSASKLPKSESFDPIPKAAYVNRSTPPASTKEQVNASSEGFFYHLNRGLLAWCSAIGLSRRGWPDYFGPVNDPVSTGRRAILALFAVLVTSLFPVFVFSPYESDMIFISSFVMIGGTSLVLLGLQWVLLPALESNATLVYRGLFGLVGSAFMIGASMVMADGLRHDYLRHMLPALATFSCIPLWLIDWRAMSSPIRPGRLSLTRVIGVGMLAIFPPAMWFVASIALAVQLGSKYDPALSQRFGLSFPWFEHFLAAIRSLTRPRKPVLSKGVQYVQATAPVGSPAVDSNPRLVETLPQVESPTKKEWELTAKVASTLNKIPVNQYSAIIADSLVKAGGSLKRFTITSICLFVIGAVWLVWAASFIGVPTLLSNTLSPGELADVEYFFGDSNWAEKVSKLPRTFSMLLVVPASIVLLRMRFANSRERGWQTVISFALLAVSLLVLGESFKFGKVWSEYGRILRSGENGLGVGQLLDQVSLMGIFFALAILIAGLYFLLIGFRSKPKEANNPTALPLEAAHASSVENQITREANDQSAVENAAVPAAVKSTESEVVI